MDGNPNEVLNTNDDVGKEMEGSNNNTNQNLGKVFLMSRRNEEHVRLPEMQSRGFVEIHQLVDQFEESVLSDINGIRDKINSLESEHGRLLRHVSLLEAHLHSANTEKEKQNLEERRLIQEINTLKEEIQKNNGSHNEQLFLIADRHRKSRLAHKVISKWRGRLRCRDKVSLLKAENLKLREELMACQEGAKKAFLRSANKLNSEALSMFQDSSIRQMENCRILTSSEDGDASCTSRTSEVSFSSSNSEAFSRDPRPEATGFVSPPRNRGDRSKMYSRCESEPRHTKRQRDFSSESDSRLRSQRENAPYNRELYRSSQKRKSSLRDPSQVPDPLRLETRQIVKQLQQKETNWEMCSSQNHVHICHCATPKRAEPSKCDSCSPAQNYNLSKMPIDDRVSPLRPFNRPKTAKLSGTRKNVAFASSSVQDGKKSVFYKPTGSTVVIEKHLPS